MSLVQSTTTERVVLYIDSKYRATGVAENFTITLNNPITKVQQCEIVTAEVPYTFYTVNATNNTMKFTVGATTYTAIVAPGNYGITSFVTALQAAMNAQFAGFTITYTKETYKLTFTNASAFSLDFTANTMVRLIGLTATTPPTTTVQPQGIINISGPKSLLIKSIRLTRPKITRPFLNTAQDDVLYKVPIADGPGTILVEKNGYTNLLRYGVRQTIDQLDFQLVDENNVQVDLNGQDWSCTINVIRG
jgi:hypothetical protein